MGVVETDKWLKESFDEPLKICTKILQEDRANTTEFYRYLLKFGMYKPNHSCKSTFNHLQKKDVWKTVEKVFNKYRTNWNGPNVPIYIFPMNYQTQLFIGSQSEKSGLSFRDKLFLFLTSDLSEREVEALFVHEYHHICRISRSQKNIKDYTLLDSIILEGLAELAVNDCCGKDYIGQWCHLYSNKQIDQYMKKYLSGHLKVKKDEKLHDQLLYGGGRYPFLLGYASGYTVVTKYKENYNFSLKESITISSDKFTPFI